MVFNIGIRNIITIGLVFLVGCASKPSATNVTISDKYTQVHMYLGGECVELNVEIYGINRGVFVDVYRDRECDIELGSVLCPKIEQSESCFIGEHVYFLDGIDDYMTLNIFEY